MLPDALRTELSALPGLRLLTQPEELERFSRDAYDYSPVLQQRLAHCRAELVVRPDTVEAVVGVASACGGIAFL